MNADVVVIGAGIIGLAVAAAVGEESLSVTLVGADRAGAAARAAAGLLVPHYSGEGVGGAVARFMSAGRDLYPAYLRWVEERSGSRVPYVSGAVEVARSPAEYASLSDAAPEDAEHLSAEDVARVEPALAPTAGGLRYPRDGAVDNVRLTDALVTIVSKSPRVRTVSGPAVRVTLDGESATVICASGAHVRARRVVLAAGAWSAGLEGLPRPIPVRPLRGQICTVAGTPLRHVVMSQHVYMVSRRGDRTLVGSTMEDVGFDPGTTPAAIDELRSAAAAMCPSLRDAALLEAWSGLRPVTPDLLPILGPDPEAPALIYACGHSRNGILLAPITAEVTRAIILGRRRVWDLSPFAVTRFD